VAADAAAQITSNEGAKENQDGEQIDQPEHRDPRIGGVVMATPGNARAEEVKCYGINKCKGTGECGGKDHSCAGKNACAGHGWLKIDKDKCLKIKGGRLTPAEGD
jgi:hypothetical protein